MLRPLTRALTFTKHLTYLPSYPYHMSYLMDSKHDDRFVKIDRRAFHLYKDSILKLNRDNFNEKIFVLVTIDCVRTKQKYEDFEQLVEYGVGKIDQFTQLLSIFSFVTQLYLYNYSNKQLSYKVAQKGFQLMHQHPQTIPSSFYITKFLIFIQKCVGLEKFPNQYYAQISFKHFKPLFLCFALEMFFKNNLQHYKVFTEIMELFTQSSSIIPFADLHHYKMATKIVNDDRFRNFVLGLERKIIVKDGGNKGEDGVEGELVETAETLFDLDGNAQQVRKGEQDNRRSRLGDKEQRKQRKDEKVRTKGAQFPWHKAFELDIYKRYTYFPSSSITSKAAPTK